MPAETHKTRQRVSKQVSRTCKTCTPCRRKKIRCDGARPQCLECSTNGLECAYPQDARREPRPSRTRVQVLETTVLAMMEHMKAAGIVPPQTLLADWMDGSGNRDGSQEGDLLQEQHSQHQEGGLMQQQHPHDQNLTDLASIAVMARQLPTPSISSAMTDKPDCHPSIHSPWDRENPDMNNIQLGMQTEDREIQDTHTTDEGSAMSPCEARVAGAFLEHGCVSSVHGLASIMNPTSRAQYRESISTVGRKGENAIAASKARLISNAALQRQREPRIFRHPSNKIDLDGCDHELAMHLLDVHFNRQHYAYLISYRPAITEGIANGGGPWVNKLLLNAIYFSGTLYSDRPSLRADLSDQNSLAAYFYRRFRQLLADEICSPSIPTAVALLLTSATLVSKGQSSAGWNLSGVAYRMLIDMGCHLMLGPDYQTNLTAGHSQLLRGDLEQEMRKRLYWGAFVTDATQSLYLGRPCMFATTEARVPLLLLDTFEEFEDWEPYIDPSSLAEPPPAYAPQPAHAISTFNCLARLFQISVRITDLYGIQTMKCTSEYLQQTKSAIERDLDQWNASLPSHLRFDPDTTCTPPPHQITPHTTFHALTILLNRAFLEEGHLRRHSDESSRERSEQACISSALAIQKFVRAYKKAFTLRRAPFLLSYAVYSAVIVILRQERHERGQFMEPISFFWTCLSELQGGCNFGLEKPLSILRDMVHEFQVSTRHGGQYEIPQMNLDETLFPQPVSRQEPFTVVGDDYDYMGMGAMDQSDPVGFDTSSPGFLASLNQLENDITQDSLYGLFAPSQLHL
ncbi:hypothetical protein ASPVEDRAFT_88908 [Aspergillus versicolor CBS 583.65]|uniref:Zn(2)-C6 fungal-type domain-containing protein n=1 Tax=Aspergillus versicolor CBS 583.65 TaxID=1036611 RepID=A0A1L9Q1N7_ASPVE|nr:uncharacterized protein ASPVEDRAFT_88908 [Aspergillus versicolor CBS 583.65]OJJ07670.1 hypothetical protein ASPVEDRAFT_88908 [Aspergillus versicolor CBS 583.65]